MTVNERLFKLIEEKPRGDTRELAEEIPAIFMQWLIIYSVLERHGNTAQLMP